MDMNVIYCGDCLQKLKDIPDGSIDLIYIDPPFSSNRNYVAFWKEQEKRQFEDRFENVRAYLDYMKPRLVELHRVLKPTGSFYYHCDWHASHYIKMLLDSDYLFGYSNFRNEIIWRRTYSHNDPNRYGRIHDAILFYTKSSKYTWNKIYQDYDPMYLETFLDQTDTNGRKYMRVDLTGAGTTEGESGQSWRGIDVRKKGRHWAYTHETLEGLDAQGKIHWPKKEGGMPRQKKYAEDLRGVPLQDIWVDIKTMHNLSSERLGYPTQKPEALLERIIRASSNEGDVVLDAFCGCGTTLAVAQREKRKWVGIDISPTACRVMAKRLEDNFHIKEGKDFHVRDLPKSIDELRQYPPFEFQNWAVNAVGGIPSRIQVRDGGIDGKVYAVEFKKDKVAGIDLFGEIDRYIPVQVKRTDQVGSPDIENFEVAMRRDKRDKGIFVGFDFSRDALKEIRRVRREENLEIEPITVKELTEKQLDKWLK